MARRLSNKRVVEYTDLFKVMVVRLTEIEGVQIKQVGEGLGLHPFMVSRWRKQLRDGQLKDDGQLDRVQMAKDRPPPKNKPKRDKLERLERENARLKKENDVLKKWRRYLKEVRQNDSDS